MKATSARVQAKAIATPSSAYEPMLHHSADSVIFRGLSEKNIGVILKSRCALDDFIPPMRDFYAEVPMKNGKTVKIRWVPFGGQFTKSEVRMYLKNQLSSTTLSDNSRGMAQYPTSEDDIVATIYASYDDMATVGYAWMRDLTLGVVMLPCENEEKLVEEGNILAKEIRDYGYQAPNETVQKAFATRDKVKDFQRVKQLMGLYAVTIQRVVYLYLSGQELPRLDLPKRPRPEPGPRPPRPNPPESPVVKNAVTKAIAYIYYDVDEGSLSISDAPKHYGAKWWIVSGHNRHYKNGKEVYIAPYIKGDRSDPNAIKALDEFVQGFRKIQTFQLLARKAR
jgi:hypothetical protein